MNKQHGASFHLPRWNPSVEGESEIKLSALDPRDEGIPFVTGVELRGFVRILGVTDRDTFGSNCDRHASLGIVLGPTRLGEIPVIDWESHRPLMARRPVPHF